MTPVLCEILLCGKNIMASSSGVSSGSTAMLRNSSSEEDPQHIMDLRKRKRMISNRESARRSRMKKQKHLDDLTGQLGQLARENNEILTRMNAVSQLYMHIEAENSILRAQMAELSHRLGSLNEIIEYANFSDGLFEPEDAVASVSATSHQIGDGFFMNPWNNASFHVNQPIMDMVMY
ncbi:bZIP transcription factor 11-like [Populus alba x Populus x berolinensis]|uniref:BZIP transcription factor 11-like n=1 Tax=Populus alba x Populus x berolinensis TaxID=444605 RepID=A0AAD6QV39_9ROSI|nr:bZIP transcription factor 11-like [Populus alba x Populus x berolinensis]